MAGTSKSIANFSIEVDAKMKLKSIRWIVYLILPLIIQVSASFPDYQLVFDDDHFMLEGIFQVLETHLGNDPPTELVISGKNYVGEEMFCYWLNGMEESSRKPVVKWQSPNLFEERSVLWTATGKIIPGVNQLLAITSSQYYFYQLEDSSLKLSLQGKHTFQPLNIACGDVDADGQDELIVARIGKITSKIYDGIVQVWRFQEGKFNLIVESGLMGNIRGLTAGDIDGDGKSEIFVDEGFKFDSGNIHVLEFKDKLVERYCLKKGVKGAVFSLKVKAFPEGNRLITASAKGKVNSFLWTNETLVPAGLDLTFDCSLVDIEAMDINGDQVPELIVAGYPQHLMILSKIAE